VSETNLKAQLAELIKLQALDSEIYALSNEKAAKPAELKAAQDAFEAKKQSLAQLEQAALDLQKQKKDKELELGSKEEGIKKLQTQLYSLKTNKEYNAMLDQIRDAKADISLYEDKILHILEEVDKLKSDTEKEKLRLKDEEKVFNGQKAKIDERVKVIDDRLAQLEAQRKQIIPAIDPKVFTQYERILQNRDGLAIVPVKDNSCQGCNMSTPPQVLNLIRMYDHLITCEICNRILYIEE